MCLLVNLKCVCVGFGPDAENRRLIAGLQDNLLCSTANKIVFSRRQKAGHNQEDVFTLT